MITTEPSSSYTGYARILATPTPAGLDAGPRSGVLPKVKLEVELARWFEAEAVPKSRQGLLKGLAFLWHDHHEDAHEIAQDDHSADGSLLHAILHRREPDYWNSCYWFRNAGMHPSFIPLAAEVGTYLSGQGDRTLENECMPGGVWDGLGFVGAVESAAKLAAGHPRIVLLQRIQELEFHAFAKYLLRG